MRVLGAKSDFDPEFDACLQAASTSVIGHADVRITQEVYAPLCGRLIRTLSTHCGASSLTTGLSQGAAGEHLRGASPGVAHPGGGTSRNDDSGEGGDAGS